MGTQPRCSTLRGLLLAIAFVGLVFVAGLHPLTGFAQEKVAPNLEEKVKKGEKKADEKEGNGKAKGKSKEKDEDEEKDPDREKLPAAVTGEVTLNLQECIAIALERQPTIRAAKLSLQASEVGSRSLVNLSPIAKRLTPDLPIRQQQSSRGLLIGRADILKAQYETVYDVTRLYYSLVYARQQETTATEIIKQMEVYYDIANELVRQGAQADLNKFSLNRMEDAISEVKKPRINARTAQQVALAALKEAMGVPQSYSFLPRDIELPLMSGAVTQEQVVAFACSRRPELTLAAAGVDAFRLEVQAQAAVQRRQKVPTLGSGSDLHARTVPSPVRNGEYRPGALSPEMPASLVGSREDRVARATELSSRQDVVYEKTQNLVELEAINATKNWEAANERFKLATVRLERSQETLDLSRKNAANIRKYDQLILTEALAAKSQAEYLEAAFETVKALATLQRVTTGGVEANFPQR
jgi:outer membrane protein TolC